MKEIGGYIELDTYSLPMLHKDAIALNCGRSCLAYLIETKKINKIALPYFICDSVKKLCQAAHLQVRYYLINKMFEPIEIDLQEDEWFYVVNFYGQLTDKRMNILVQKYKRVIIDQAQAYFEKPIKNAHNLYTCRKFFGVPDGAFLYTDEKIEKILPKDVSFKRMTFLLGRFERPASEFYNEYVENNRLFDNEPIKLMSKLTNNLLHGIDYEYVKQKRTANYNILYEKLKEINRLKPRSIKGAYAYPLWIKKGDILRKKLLEYKIYIPTLWPNVLNDVCKGGVEYDMTENILPIPVDQRYDREDMNFLVRVIRCTN